MVISALVMAEPRVSPVDDLSDDSASAVFELQAIVPPPSLPGSCQKSQQDEYEGSALVFEEVKSVGGDHMEVEHQVGPKELPSGPPADDGALSPTLLHELNYVPMRITRSMASLRNAFDRGMGLSPEAAETKTPPKTGGKKNCGKAKGGKVKKAKNGCPTEPATKKTGKRSTSRGGRSGWAKNAVLDQESHVETVCSTITIQPVRGRPLLTGKAVRVPVREENPGNGCVGDSNSGQGGDSSGVTEGETIKVHDKQEQVPARGKSTGIGWVMCDDCNKWRCISSELADAIEATDVRWTCRDNPNTEFADCLVPQEKTNAEINADLNISDASTSDEEDAAVDSKSRASWTAIGHNIFPHRRPKKLDDDESLICHCKVPEDGSPACGDDCLNRMVNVECSAETCPCGDQCSNQQFRKRAYAKVKLVKCGKKGHGLRIMEDTPKGTFIIEYVGEVLNMAAFEHRQKEYSRQRQKHFYFMTLNSNEVIDACKKGNLGRFINHSCEPNCQTEKWCVNGEISIGLFAIRDLVKGEEITFNYNFERLFGAAAKRCRCGSSNCRGYIGREPLPGAVIESDSDSDLEPIMLKEDDDEDEMLDASVLVQEPAQQPSSVLTEQSPAQESVQQVSESMLQDSVQESVRDSVQESVQETKVSETVTYEPVPCAKPTRAKEKSEVARVKRAKPVRAKKVSSKGFAFSKPESYRPARPLHSEVEEKLDKLLDQQGGLLKKKDTPKQYLKLLVISTASGDASKEGASCSIRDLSLLLDAMMKTTSRNVLTEVIQKNGLQLLHNLVKQSRKSFNKIPILRKLLKVLELLATRKILKKKHMSCTPPRDGMESFVKSMLELTRHEDAEVQLISRRFQKEYLSDIICEERNRGDYRHWGGDRYGGVQKRDRELFRKSEERPFHSNHHNNMDDNGHSSADQEARKRRRISRWDEKPPIDAGSVVSERPHQVHHYHHQNGEVPVWNDEAGPPGYSCRPSSQERVRNSDQYSRQDFPSGRHQQYHSAGYMNRGRSQSQGSYSEYCAPQPPLQHHHSAPATAGPYQQLPPPPPAKYYSPPAPAPASRPVMNGCYPPPRPRGPPSSQFQHGGYGYAQLPGQVAVSACADEEPPVPGL